MKPVSRGGGTPVAPKVRTELAEATAMRLAEEAPGSGTGKVASWRIHRLHTVCASLVIMCGAKVLPKCFLIL